MPRVIYLDNAASMPMRPEAIEAMADFAREHGANPSSIHASGLSARKALEADRAAIAAFVGCEARELVFTSGATEADNLAIRGALEARLRAGGRVHAVSTTVEHAAVRETLRDLEARGLETAWIAPDATGAVSAEAVLSAVRPETALVSVMAASNETGARQPIAEIAAGLRALGANRPLFHVDAVQGVVAETSDFKRLGIDLASFSAHKIGGPKGVGALAVRHGVILHPATAGGGHEGGRRSGTENGPGIAGFAAAAKALSAPGERERFAEARVSFLKALSATGCGAKPIVPEAASVANVLAVECPGAEADWLVLLLSRAGVMASAGSACSSGTRKSSAALAAMGLSEARARSVVRFSFGLGLAEEDAALAAKALADAMRKKA